MPQSDSEMIGEAKRQDALEREYLRSWFLDATREDPRIKEHLVADDEVESAPARLAVRAIHACLNASEHPTWERVESRMLANVPAERRLATTEYVLDCVVCDPRSVLLVAADELRKRAQARRQHDALTAAAGRLTRGTPVAIDELAGELRAREVERSRASRHGSDALFRDAAADFLRRCQPGSDATRALLGFDHLDAALGGLDPGALLIIGARPSVGKSTCALAIADARADVAHRTGVVSVEDPASVWGQRYLSRRTNVNATKLRMGVKPNADDVAQVGNYVNSFGPASVDADGSWILEDVRGEIDDVLLAFDHLVGRDHVTLLVLDYVQRVRVPGARDRRIEVATVCKMAKDKARALGVPLVLLSQIKRIEGSEPSLMDLKEAGDLEEMAEYALLMWEHKGSRYARVAKNKTGVNGGKFEITWDTNAATIRGFVPCADEFNEEPVRGPYGGGR